VSSAYPPPSYPPAHPPSTAYPPAAPTPRPEPVTTLAQSGEPTLDPKPGRGLRQWLPYVAIPAAVILVVTLAVVLAQGGTPPTNVGNHTPGPTDSSGDNTPASSFGPAPTVAGATNGGTITVLEPYAFDYIDPARTYVSTDQMLDQLVTRSLTGYQEIPQANGSVRSSLVGDLATDVGRDIRGDCTVWQYTLKSGLKYEDGSVVIPADVAYGVARTFSPDFPEGPKYLANWLTGNPSTSADFNRSYKGPYNGADLKPPNVTISGSTITFTFAHPECDMPYVAAMPITAAVPKAHDGGQSYDQHPWSTGPYKVGSHTASALTLVRNTYWDPKLDAIHNAYPDQITFVLDVDHATINQRLAADASADQTALTWENVSISDAVSATAKARAISGPTQYVDYLAINNQRVSSLAVRRAINIALDKISVLNAGAGDLGGTVTNTILPPNLPGWQNYDVFNASASGDPAKASAAMNGQTPQLTLCYADSTVRKAMAQTVQTSLQKAGFVITLRSIPASDYYTQIGQSSNTCDLYRSGWGADYPSASSIIPQLLDGRTIATTGNTDVALYNSASTNAEIDHISAESDRTQAAADWAALDKRIMQNDAPVVPIYTFRVYSLAGSRVGGAFDSPAFGLTSLNRLYVKS
jgi:peptide/nickel transport system substrate-binding protein